MQLTPPKLKAGEVTVLRSRPALDEWMDRAADVIRDATDSAQRSRTVLDACERALKDRTWMD